jgi:hypothetical protein
MLLYGEENMTVIYLLEILPHMLDYKLGCGRKSAKLLLARAYHG